MDVIRELHTVLSKTSILFFALLGIWGVIRAFRGQGIGPSYLGALVIGEGVFVLQAVLGVILLFSSGRPDRIIHLLLHNYTRLAFINTELKDLDAYQGQARQIAERFELRYEEIKGSNALVKQLLLGPWDDRFVVIPPGEEVQLEHYFRMP